MIKIIKKGNSHFKRLECYACGCIFEFTQDEVEHVKYTASLPGMAGPIDYNVTKIIIHCPDCNAINILNERDFDVRI